MQTFTTVGFGDIYPVTVWGMALFPLASLGGITLTAASVAQFAIHVSNTLKWVKIKNILSAFVIVIATASVLFMALEDWSWWQSIFFLYSCASTTGLSEEVPVTSGGRIAFCLLMTIFFTIFTVLIRLIVHNFRHGSEAEIVDHRKMSRSILSKQLRKIVDDETNFT